MDSKKMGELIAGLRKEKGMTQKELAEKLNVTDKAVSKWERGNGYPEIEILPVLAEVLGITVNELFSGQRNTSGSIQLAEAEVILSDTIEYVETASRHKTSNLVFMTITAAFLLSAFVCVLCNYAINAKLDWSLYPLGGLVVSWLTLAPAMLLKKHRAVGCLAGLTISAVPYLFLVEHLSPAKGWVVPLALPITALTVVFSAIAIGLFVYTKMNRWYVAAIVCMLFGVVLNVITNTMVENYLHSDKNNMSNTITALSLAFVSVLLAAVGYAKRVKRRR